MDSVVQLINKSLAEIGKRLGVVDSIKGVLERSVSGTDDGGNYRTPQYDTNGHIEVAVHSPRLPFGAIHAEHITPIFQTDAVYGVNSGQVTTVATGTGGVTVADSEFVLTTGTTSLSQAVLLGRRRLRYRPGQGVIARFTARFTAPVAYSYQLAGIGHAEDGLYFGHGNTINLNDTRFGILYVNRGVREVQTLTVTTGATGAGNVTITLNGTANTIAVTGTGATAGERIQKTVWDLSVGTYSGWDAYPVGATVVFVRKSAGTASGTYSFAAGGTGSAAAFAQTKAGAPSTDLFIPQAEWNGDPMDGSGPSGVTLDPTKGNVYKIDVQYLGFGTMTFGVEVAPEGGNNATFVTVHTIRSPNTRTQTTLGNPAFPFTAAAYSAGSTTNLTVAIGSYAGFIEGQKRLHGNRFCYLNTLTTVGATNIQALLTVMNTRYYGGRTNQAVIQLMSIHAALKHTSPCTIYLIRNGTLAGFPSFASYATNSCSTWDTAATTVTYATNDQLIWVGMLGDTGDLDHEFANVLEEITLQPGEWVTLGAKAATGTPSYVTGSINTREDQ